MIAVQMRPAVKSLGLSKVMAFLGGANADLRQ
jgi:hypothetical protein